VIGEVEKRENTYTGSKGKLPGIIDSPNDVGGWPEYRSGNAPPDTDGDGLPDDWEKANGLDPGNAADGAKYRPDGYTNLEYHLNILAAPAPQRPSADPKYRETINKRAASAVNGANVADDSKKAAAIKVVEAHYVSINDIHFDRAAAVKAAGSDNDAITSVMAKAAAEVAVVHKKFTDDLAALLTPEQCNAVKDKMTYDVRRTTFRVYCEMLPKLTDGQKTKISDLLLAGREDALVAGDANRKHEQFRRAKGRINNYLSAQGYDMKKASEDWAARQKAKAPRIPNASP